MTASPGERAAALARVRAALVAAGATDDDVDRAAADDVLDLLAVDLLLVPPGRRYTTAEVSDATGLPAALLRRFWLALGLREPAEGEPVLDDLDVEAARLFQTMVRLGVTDVDSAVQLARVIGSSAARIAEAITIRAAESLGAEEDSVLAADAFVSGAGEVLPAMDRLLAYVWRRHVQAATRRTMLLRTHGREWGTRQEVAVGFADMVGFTVLSQHLEEPALAAVVQRFEEVANEVVTGLGGRVVKTIGDEAMFVVDDGAVSVRIGLALADAYAGDDLLSDVRVGLAFGSVLANDGDYFGPTVNLASRVVGVAVAGAVLASDDLHRRLLSQVPGEFSFAPFGPCALKDVGTVPLWWCGRAGHEPVGGGGRTDARRGLRWLAPVVGDLDALRALGQRFLAERRAGHRPPGDGSGSVGEPEGGDPAGP